MSKKYIVFLLFTVPLFLYFLVLHIQIQRFSQQEVPKGADFLIILGAKVDGTTPSLSLQFRIDAAAIYLLENPQTIVIATGGQGPDEDLTEAETIKRELVAKGINANRIKLEGNSTTTEENIKLSIPYLPNQSQTGIVVSNDYHLYRAIKIGNDEGLQLIGLPAKTPILSLPKSYIREYLAITKYYLKNKD
ncbi:YdcF family protein [Halalkalibacter krulwichiae]|uniref:DUF218 domain-containing protein n=1 Tax=Halalkalibacter krulwichiae TaxID=199441 RepID=A0A1X9MAW7_9BACI|nr:YdcF family protein [Halalkalibacter krulwichiae]ARK30557.1 hypothetical protein BkAM31D_12355 [Halalkalibacter krulwichiae]